MKPEEKARKGIDRLLKVAGWKVQDPRPFAYESTGIETFFRDLRDPETRSRRVFAFHRPETLKDWLSNNTTLRARLKNMPPLRTEGLRDCQIEAIENIEISFSEARPRALIQMATGSGKTDLNAVTRNVVYKTHFVIVDLINSFCRSPSGIGARIPEVCSV